MSEGNDCEWGELKKVVRSVLLSDVKNGLKLREFGGRYRQLSLRPLEHRKFGFNTASDLLKAMPDVVRFETSARDNEVILHAEVGTIGDVYITPAVRRTAQKLKKQLSLGSDSESEVVPRKKVQGTSSTFTAPDYRMSGHNRSQYAPQKFDFRQMTQRFKTQREETDPVRGEIASQMAPNTRGYYAILVPRHSISSAEEIEDVFSAYGDIMDVSWTEYHCFIRYQHRHQAVSAVLDTRAKLGTKVPKEKGNPTRLIKAKDIMNKPSCSRQMATDVSTPLMTAGSMKEESLEDVEVFVGNINLMSKESDVLQRFANYNIKGKRFVTKDIKRFAFLTVVGLDVAERMCHELHKTTLDGRELVVQVSYVSTNECMPAIEPAIPEEDLKMFTNTGPAGIYKQFASFDDRDDSDNDNRLPANDQFVSMFNRPRGSGHLSSGGAGDAGWGPSLTVNLSNSGQQQRFEDLPTLGDDYREAEYESSRTVVYYPPADGESSLESLSDSDMECNVQLNPGSREHHVILEGFPYQTHFKFIYKEFRKVGIERLKVDIVNNYEPNPTLAIVTFDNEASVQEALKWDGKDFNYQPMYIRRLNPDDLDDTNMLRKVKEGKRNEEFHDQERRRPDGGHNDRKAHSVSVRGRGAPLHHNQRYQHRGHFNHRGGGLPRSQCNGQTQGNPNFPAQRLPFHASAHHNSRQFSGRGNMNRPPFTHQGPRMVSRPPHFPNQNYQHGFQPRGFQHSRGRGRGYSHESERPVQNTTRDPYEPTEEDLTLSAQMAEILKDCFPEGCLPWISKDLPEESEVHVAEILNDRYFFGHVTNGLPGIEIKELSRKMADQAYLQGAEPFCNPSERRCGAFYAESDQQSSQLFRAWIREFHDDGQCEIFFIDWGNSTRDTSDKLRVIRDIHWTMRPQIVLFKIDNTSRLQRTESFSLRVLTKNVYENNYVVPVEYLLSE